MMVEMAVTRSKIGPVWEQYYPLAFGLGAALAWLSFGQRISCMVEQNGWHFDQLYSAFFGFASITTGFLATFYGTVHSMSSGFIHRIRGTKALAGFLRLSKRAIVMGFVSAIATVPMLIGQPLPTRQFSIGAFLVAIWLGIAVWAIAGFWRVASSLFLLFETASENNRGVG